MNIGERLTHESSEIDESIIIDLPEVKHGSKTMVTYNGILSNKGADKVYMHYGFDGWHNTDTQPMKKNINGCFNAEVQVRGHHQMEFCFKDSANNWDNNNGTNWKVDIDY